MTNVISYMSNVTLDANNRFEHVDAFISAPSDSRIPPNCVCLFHNDNVHLIFIPSHGTFNVEVSEYMLSSSFQLELHTIVLSKGIMCPSRIVTAIIYTAHACQNDLGHNF